MAKFAGACRARIKCGCLGLLGTRFPRAGMPKVQTSGRFRGNIDDQRCKAQVEDELVPNLWQSLGINLKIMPFMDGN